MAEQELQQIIRRNVLDERRRMSPDERRVESEIICQRFVSSPWFRSASDIAIYLPADDEVDTTEIIFRAWRAQKRIHVPVIGKKGRMFFSPLTPDSTLIRNRFGLLQTAGHQRTLRKQLDVVLCPLVAVDETQHRIGMGGGYYDRYFQSLRMRTHYRRPRLIGLAFACQFVEKIPTNPWDTPLFATISSF